MCSFQLSLSQQYNVSNNTCFSFVALLNEQILDKDEELAVKENKVITSMLNDCCRHEESTVNEVLFFSLSSCVKSGNLLHSLLARVTTLLDLFGDVLVKKIISLLHLTSDLRDLRFFYPMMEILRSLKSDMRLYLCKESK